MRLHENVRRSALCARMADETGCVGCMGSRARVCVCVCGCLHRGSTERDRRMRAGLAYDRRERIGRVTLSHFSQQLFDTLANILHTVFRSECMVACVRSCFCSCKRDAMSSMPRLAIYFRVQIHGTRGVTRRTRARQCAAN